MQQRNPYEPPSAQLHHEAVAAPTESRAELRYATFWQRFLAYWVDVLVLLPVIAIPYLLAGKTRFFYMYWLIPGLVIGLFFHVYLVKRYWGHPGKAGAQDAHSPGRWLTRNDEGRRSPIRSSVHPVRYILDRTRYEHLVHDRRDVLLSWLRGTDTEDGGTRALVVSRGERALADLGLGRIRNHALQQEAPCGTRLHRRHGSCPLVV